MHRVYSGYNIGPNPKVIDFCRAIFIIIFIISAIGHSCFVISVYMGRQNANQTPALFRSGLVLLLVSINDGDYGDYYYYWIDSLRRRLSGNGCEF